MAKNINKNVYSDETLLKLDIFRECFREWFPVFLHNKFISTIFIYDFFAGSGTDIEGTSGSPLILLEEARGDKNQHCVYFRNNEQKIAFAFNEVQKRKVKTLELKVSEFFEQCKNTCSAPTECPYINNCHFKHEDFKDLFLNDKFRNALSNPNYGKFILLDQYGFKHVNEDVFALLTNSPKTDFIFFITSSSIKRFHEQEVVRKYLKDKKINFDESKPRECHRIIAQYFKSFLPETKEYYLHHFTIQNKTNYYGLIFGTGHSLGMEKFLKVCWKHDQYAGESNCNMYDDFEPDTLFHSFEETNKKEIIINKLRGEIIAGKISNNISALKFVLKEGGRLSLYLDLIQVLIKSGKIEIIGDFNKQISNIHRIKEYSFKVK
jgi:three-Cys-motif partner protein